MLVLRLISHYIWQKETDRPKEREKEKEMKEREGEGDERINSVQIGRDS